MNRSKRAHDAVSVANSGYLSEIGQKASFLLSMSYQRTITTLRCLEVFHLGQSMDAGILQMLLKAFSHRNPGMFIGGGIGSPVKLPGMFGLPTQLEILLTQMAQYISVLQLALFGLYCTGLQRYFTAIISINSLPCVAMRVHETLLSKSWKIPEILYHFDTRTIYHTSNIPANGSILR